MPTGQKTFSEDETIRQKKEINAEHRRQKNLNKSSAQDFADRARRLGNVKFREPLHVSLGRDRPNHCRQCE